MEKKNFCSIVVPFEITKSEVIKNDETGDEFFHFKGYASTFGNIDKANDVVVKGAFVNSINIHKSRNEDFPALWQHDTHTPIGVLPVVDMFEDSKGLFVHGILPLEDTFVSGRVKPQMKVGSVRKMSIGFNIVEATDEKDSETNMWIRFIKEADLMEISLVTFPCNTEADITEVKHNKDEVKKMIEEIKDLSGVETLLKERGGFSANESKSIVSKISELKTAARDAEQKAAEEAEQAERDAGLADLTKGFNDLTTICKDLTNQKES
ncbi:MAG: HK97 family phage prohead protease [Chloroflexi bacterium]|nr:MAG: HK97 family phage prohead protease [Chloroflexota bacterium]